MPQLLKITHPDNDLPTAYLIDGRHVPHWRYFEALDAGVASSFTTERRRDIRGDVAYWHRCSVVIPGKTRIAGPILSLVVSR